MSSSHPVFPTARRCAGRAAMLLAVAFALSACGLFAETRNFDAAEESTLPYMQELSRQYDALAADEEAEYDWRDGARFRDRALRARYGEFLAPEALDYRDLPVSAVADLTAARTALVAALDQGGPLLAGPAAARAQAAFDCWMQEQEENHQPEHIAACRTAFEAAMMELRDLGSRLIVVLLPDPSGKVGAVELANAGASERLGAAGESGVMARDVAPSPAGTLDSTTVRRFFGAVLDAQPQPPVSFVLEFVSGTDQPTAQSQALLPDVLAAIRARTAPDITVIGHSDRQGAAGANYRLALRRAEVIADLVYDLGVERDTVEVRSFGETDPLVPTADGVAEARNRRVEITIR